MQINRQPPERAVKTFAGLYDLHSIFSTIQGEGPFAGCPATFIRLAGCNLQCPGCDTLYTTGRQWATPGEIHNMVKTIDRMNMRATSLFVITGGEPLRQDITHLVDYLLTETDAKVQIETNGVLPLPPLIRDSTTVVCSPKTSKISPTMAAADVFKYVLEHGHVSDTDGLPTRSLGHKATPCVARPPVAFKGEILVHPMDSQNKWNNELNTVTAVESALMYGYRLGLQLHKIINLP